jgi:hypothetical protein
VFGPVGTLQNVAVISSMQITPVVGPVEVLGVVPVVVAIEVPVVVVPVTHWVTRDRIEPAESRAMSVMPRITIKFDILPE